VAQPHPQVDVLGIEREHLPLLERSRQALFDFRLNEAERLLERVLADGSPRPYAYFMYVSVAFWRAMVEDVESAYDRFYLRSDSLLSRLEATERTKWKRLIRAEAYLQRAVILGKTEQFLRAAWAGRTVYHSYANLVDDHSEFYPAYYGMGLVHVLLGSLPGTYRWILARIGISGTVEGGLRELTLAAEKSAFNGVHARATLGVIDIILNQEKEQGVERLRKLHEAHPNSLMFAHLYGYGLYSIRDAPRAQEVFETALEKRENSAYHFIDFVTFYLGEVYFVQNKFGRAEQSYREFLENYRGHALIALARLRCGLALEMQDQHEEAREYYRRVSSERSFDSDEYALRTAAERLENPMTETERRLLRGANHYEAGLYESAVEVLMPVYNNPELQPVERAEAAFYLGRVRHAQDRPKDALTYYGHAANDPGDRSEKWLPWSQFYIGTIYAEWGESGKARALFEQVLSYDHEYDYKKALEQRTHTAMDTL
jgi:TolA-binding protein